jgi:hypothetical protein
MSGREGFHSPLKRWNLITSISLSAVSFFVYLSTMSRSMSYIDGGEITTVLWTLGIAHPTGYPLFTLLGYAFIHLPFFHEVVQRANFFAVVCTAIAGGTFYYVFLLSHVVLATDGKDLDLKKSKKVFLKTDSTALESRSNFAILSASVAATLTLMFSKTFWTQSTVIESYPLQLLLFAIIFVAWLKLYSSPGKQESFLAGFALGLGFTNHMTTILTVPSLIFLLILMLRTKKLNRRIIQVMILGGALAGLLYLYLPIRASQHPLLNWGNPDNLKRFIWHVTAKQFRTWMFSSFDVFQHQLNVFYSNLYTEFRVSILIAVLGFFVSAIYYKKLFWWTTILLVSDLIYAANYSIHNIESYFLLAYISIVLFITVGFRFIVERLSQLSLGKTIITFSILFFPIFSAFSNYKEVDASKDHAVEMYVRDILTSLPKNSVIISYQWDIFVSASLYYQNVDGLRPDVIVIDKELLRRSWYASQVHNRYNFLFPKEDLIYDEYQANLKLFENDLPYDPTDIERSYSNFIREIIFGSLNNGREVFVGPEIENQYLYGFNKIPYGLLFELKEDTSYVPFHKFGLSGFRAAMGIKNDYSHQIINFYFQMFQARAAYEYVHKNLNLASFWLDEALNIDPSSQPLHAEKLQVLQQITESNMRSSKRVSKR